MLRQLIWCPLDWIKNCLNYNEDFLKFVGRFINFAARQYDWRFSDTKQANLSGRKSVKPDKENLEPHQPSTINHQPPTTIFIYNYIFTVFSLQGACKMYAVVSDWFLQVRVYNLNESIHPSIFTVCPKLRDD